MSGILVFGDHSMENTSGNFYEITIKEPIDACWSDWLHNFKITRINDQETRLSGWIADQTALYGLLNTLCNLNLTLIGVRKVENSDS